MLAASAARGMPAPPSVVPPIDEFSGIMADIAEDGRLGDESTVASEGERARILDVLDRAFAERIAMLERAEALLRRAAEEQHLAPEEVRDAVEGAFELKQAAFEAALAAVEDIEIPVDARRAVYAMVAEIEARSARIAEAFERLECTDGDQAKSSGEVTR